TTRGMSPFLEFNEKLQGHDCAARRHEGPGGCTDFPASFVSLKRETRCAVSVPSPCSPCLRGAQWGRARAALTALPPAAQRGDAAPARLVLPPALVSLRRRPGVPPWFAAAIGPDPRARPRRTCPRSPRPGTTWSARTLRGPSPRRVT